MIVINYPEDVKFIIDCLMAHQYKAYIVGGAVRDSLLEKKPKDWDICTNATPNEVEDVFKNRMDITFVHTGLKHGTITLMKNGRGYEITTFRIDKEYKDKRHCDIEYTSDLQADLLRRDFTINALAYNEYEGLIDYFNGQKDLSNKIIRCVGDPNKRFNEDGLRILRALRFKTQLGFEIEKETELSLLNNSNLLDYISKERIRDELDKILQVSNCDTTINKYIAIFKKYVFRTDKILNLKSSNKNLTRLVSCKEVLLAYLLKDLSIEENLFILGHPYGLLYDNKVIKSIKNIKLFFDENIQYKSIEAQKYYLKRLLNTIGKNEVVLILRYMFYVSGDTKKFVQLYNLMFQIINSECYKISQLVINGNDLKKMGYKGKEIGIILNNIFDEVIKGNVNNNIHSIIHFLKEYRT